jgi:hypothetical protein
LINQIPLGRWTTKDALAAAATAWLTEVSDSTLTRALQRHPFRYRVLRKKNTPDRDWRIIGGTEDERAGWHTVLNLEIPGLKWNMDLEGTSFWLEVTDAFFWNDFWYQDFNER